MLRRHSLSSVAVPGADYHGQQLEALQDLLTGRRGVVLSGAGVSTDSGIPDYRGPTGSRRRSQPMTYGEFCGHRDARQRYWARSHLGWRHVATALPNAGHRAVAALEVAGIVDGVVTQNVDGLHTAAGSKRVIDLHGRLDTVVCLDCGDRRPRLELALRLAALNPAFERAAATIAPDGDADIDADSISQFRLADCRRCGGVLKPDVVFFGESVPRARVAHAMEMVDEAGVLLVVGSSLSVMSGYRFVLRARRLGIPVAILNQGPTRGDSDATLLIEAPLGVLLPALADRLCADPPQVASH